MNRILSFTKSMLVRGILAAALGVVLHRSKSVSDKKGKATALSSRSDSRTPVMSPTTTTAAAVAAATPMGKIQRQRNYTYGSIGSGRFERLSRSGERLDSVPEQEQVDVDEREGEGVGEGEPFLWNDLEGGGSESCNESDEDFEEWDASRCDYGRALRWYSIVPLGSILFLVFIALLPKLIAPKPLPSSPSLFRLLLSTILSASLWCLAHSFRVPLYSVLDWILSGFITAASFLCCPKFSRRTRRRSSEAYIASLTSVIHVLVLAFLQESLRVAAFAILDLRWYQPDGRPTSTHHPRAHDAAFHEVWTLAMGWALAEVCAGILQGYEQLGLYANSDQTSNQNQRASDGSSKSGDGDEVVQGNGADDAIFGEEAADMVRWRMPCIGLGDDDDVDGVKALTQVEIDEALIRLANVRAREELEELYGQPYIEIPVFVTLLQRLDSILLSLGNTLLLAAAYLPLPPYSSSLSTTPSPAPSTTSLRESPSHTHMIPLLPAFFIVAVTHSALGILHSPPVLARVGIPAAAYASCMVGLALTFAGVGVWVGLW